MARFAFILPREEMVEQAQRIAAELKMEVVLNRFTTTERVMEAVEQCRQLGADIIVARGRQASILKESTDFPVVEIQLTGQEVALLLHRARNLVAQIARPKIGVVTIPNMIGDISSFEKIFDIALHTYFVSDNAEMLTVVEKAVSEGMDVILGGDFVNAYCRRLGKRTLFFDGTEDSIRTSLRNARNVGFAADSERRNTAHLQVLLDYSFNGIIELDAQGVILRINDIACKILERSRNALVGYSLIDLMPQADAETWENVLLGRRELYFAALELAGVDVVANAAPASMQDEVEGVVFSFYEMHKMERQDARALQERYRQQRYLAIGHFEDVSDQSREMRRLIQQANTFAESGRPVLIQGEVGSGKSLLAQSIHNASPCAKGPFVTFNCGANWDDLCDALSQAGKNANSGTLYLDNLERLPREGQYVLSRIIRDGVVHPRGESEPLVVAVRVVASLTGKISDMVSADILLPELYYLLAPLQLNIPPISARIEDLNRYIDAFLDKCAARFERYVALTKEARKVLLEYRWPGNYLQLGSFLERLVLTAPSRTVREGYIKGLIDELYPVHKPLLPTQRTEAKTLSSDEECVRQALCDCKGNRLAAAEKLGISKTTLWRKMKKYDIHDRYDN